MSHPRSLFLASLAMFGLSACSTLFDDSLAGGGGGPSMCGNGIIDAGEACDDALPLVQTCAGVLGPSATGNARCTACGLDLRGCVGGGGASGRGGAGGKPGGSGGAGGATIGGAAGASGGGGVGQGGAISGGQGGLGGGPSAGAGGAIDAGSGGSGGTGIAGGGSSAASSGASGATSGAGGAAAGKAGSSAGTGGASAGQGGSGAATGGTGASSGSGGSPGGSGGSGPTCTIDCGPFRKCVGANVCVCGDETTAIGAGCWPTTPKAAALRTKEEVCAARAMGKLELEPEGIVKGTGECGPWSLSPAKLADFANRLAYFRWLAGVGPLVAAPGEHGVHASCAAATAFESGALKDGGQCVTAEVIAASKRCSRITGNGAETPFDILIPSKSGTGFGHVPRRILLSSNAQPFFLGLFEKGADRAGSCVEVPLDPAAPNGPYGSQIWPPAGFVPSELADAPWSIGPIGSTGAITVSIVRSPPGTTLAASALRLIDGATGGPVALLTRTNWVPIVGRSYVVTFQEAGQQPITYGFEPIDCGP